MQCSTDIRLLQQRDRGLAHDAGLDPHMEAIAAYPYERE